MWIASRRFIALVAAFSCAGVLSTASEPETFYFADGYHGGVYGHYPRNYTAFLVGQLRVNPDWKINLEIEPDTWDVARVSEPEAYAALQAMMEDQSDGSRIEIVNPTYAQSYFFQSSGESAIRQFDYGIRKLREHFPDVVLTTYSSEEPCFTSCLPPILKSFGYEFAVLKNPNTCWGGYTSAHGGELVTWIGPDGTSILTVPRYASEALQPDSCWQTIAFRDSPEYISACVEQGIEHPAGMCLQDAGWRGGPWLGPTDKDRPVPLKYITWRDYIRNITSGDTEDDWRFTQEDVKPGLMWGSQVLQRIAQQSRAAESGLKVAEKLAAMARIDSGRPSMTDAFDEAWHNVLLSQHHDCWIVPYNGRPGNTWADQVRQWTRLANAVSDLSVNRSLQSLLEGSGGGRRRRRGSFVRLFNPTAVRLDVVVPVPFRETDERFRFVSESPDGRRFDTQIVSSDGLGLDTLLVRGVVPPMGYATVELTRNQEATEPPVTVTTEGGRVVMESDCYRIEFDPSKGGSIRSLVAKKHDGREFVDTGHERLFNEIRGHFYEQGGFHSSADQPAEVTIVENGPLRATVEISGTIAGNPFVQRVSINQASPIIDCSVRIDWQGNPRIGRYGERDGWRNRRRPAYDDRYKLLVHFPASLTDRRISKSAAFDVCESGLQDTFYSSWEDIKHNVILDWVDAADGSGTHGLSLFSDHTTSYVHGPEFPLSLTLQYVGKGLWGRDYRVERPTTVRYALMPHAGRWDDASVPGFAEHWQEPPVGAVTGGGGLALRSLIDPGDSGWTVPAMFERDVSVLVRVFNATGDAAPQELGIGFESGKIELVELDGRVIEEPDVLVDDRGQRTVRLAIPRFGIRTLRFSDIRR